jgi:hypothetical protein
MPKKNLQGGFFDLIEEIVRESSAAMRFGFLAGLGAAIAGIVYMILDVPAGEWRYAARGVVIVGFFLLIGGILVGLAAGSVLEVLVNRLRDEPSSPSQKKQRRGGDR